MKTTKNVLKEKFPVEIVTKMLENQIKQGNKADINVFVKYPAAGKKEGGFDWNLSLEGYEFWADFFDSFCK